MEEKNLISVVARPIKCIYRKENFTIISAWTKDTGNIPMSIKVQNNSAFIILAGIELPDTAVDIKFYGQWKKSNKGDKFDVEYYELQTPTTKKGLITFLASDIFPGIGPKTAERIVERFGMETIDILDNRPMELLEISGITPERLGRIKKGYEDARSYSELAMFLANHGVSGTIVKKVNREYGKKAIDIILENPYSLMSVLGIGFKTCDKIAKSLKVQLDSFVRIKGATIETIKELCNSTGGMYADKYEMYQVSMQKLNEGITPQPVSKERFAEVFDELTKRRIISYRFKKFVFLTEYDNAERNTAIKLLQLLSVPIDIYGISQVGGTSLKYELERYCRSKTPAPSEEQKEAILKSLTNNVSIITGGPGTGKTTIIKGVIEVAKNFFRCQITCMAPTGKAARRMQEVTGLKATTIHSRLHLYDSEDCKPQPIKNGLVIIDEVSMVDNLVMEKVLEAVQLGCQIVLCGDINQLPSVGVGAVLRELIKSGEIPTTILTKTFRQAEGNSIIENSKKINEGNTNLEYDDDFVFVPVKDEDEAVYKVCEIYDREISERGIDNVALLTPLRNTQNGRLKCVSDAINSILQDVANPERNIITNNSLKEVVVGDKKFRLGDRVLQWHNQSDGSSANGDTGEIVQIYDDEEDEGITLVIEWENGNIVHAHKDDIESIGLAYAMSVHKSQGSEYECVIIPVLSAHSCRLFKRNMLYTGVTRAKKKVYLIGDKEAINKCIKSCDTHKRNTLLAERIKYNAKLGPIKP